LVDDHIGFVTSARALLTHEGMDIVATASNAAEAIRMCANVRPDVVLLDIHLPDRSGVDVAHTLAERGDAPDMILISSDIDAAAHPEVLSAPVSPWQNPLVERVIGSIDGSVSITSSS